ncbi:MAG: hypothetical protein HFH91_18425 [Lachnospiraceae bacterium]|nr:hypothetical protein [Lachnospiraceae bacterium]
MIVREIKLLWDMSSLLKALKTMRKDDTIAGAFIAFEGGKQLEKSK